MRIVSGAARGRRLQAPRGKATRPTTDRVREAMFSSITSYLSAAGVDPDRDPWADIRVLDLFAGSGALGLEALSRGAASVTFVERDRAAVGALRANIDVVGLPGAHIKIADVYRWAAMGECAANPRSINLLFADPPYEQAAADLQGLLGDLRDGDCCADGSLVVVERESRDTQSPFPEASHHGWGFTRIDRRTYGETCLWYGRLGSVGS